MSSTFLIRDVEISRLGAATRTARNRGVRVACPAAMDHALLANLSAEVAGLRTELADVRRTAGTAAEATDVSWILSSSITVFLMQCGFGMLESGFVRAKNTKNILMKNLVDTCVCTLVFWLVGWSVAFGGSNAFIGPPIPHTADMTSGVWFHQFVYASASSTIVSGAIAERTQPVAYVVHSLFMMAVLYPVVAHWVWSEAGFLSTRNPEAVLGGAIDFAGGAVVHLTGAPPIRPPTFRRR